MSLGSALLIIYTDETAQLSSDALASALGESQPQSVQGVDAAIGVLAQGGFAPKYIAIDIGKSGVGISAELERLAHVCEPDVSVVVVGQVNDVSLYRSLIQRGIVEYYAYPLDYNQIAKSLRNAQRSSRSDASSRPALYERGFSVGFMSAASGDGASTVALNTAYILANRFNCSVALVDLDYQFGMIARNLDLKAPYGIRELLEYPDRGVDAALLNKMLVPYGNNLKIVAAPPDLRKLPDVRADQIISLLQVLQAEFDFVFFDIQHIWVDWVATLLSRMNHRVLVGQLWLRSLTHVTRMLAAWDGQGIKREEVSLIVNRSGSKFKEAMTSDDFEHVSGMKIKFLLPNDTKSIVASESQGKTVAELGNSSMDKSLHSIAEYLYSQYTGKIPDKQPDFKKNMFGFLSKKA